MLRAIFFSSIFLCSPLVQAQDATARHIVALGKSDPHAMDWLDVLSNRFGGRMTGSDAYTHAAQWSAVPESCAGVRGSKPRSSIRATARASPCHAASPIAR